MLALNIIRSFGWVSNDWHQTWTWMSYILYTSLVFNAGKSIAKWELSLYKVCYVITQSVNNRSSNNLGLFLDLIKLWEKVRNETTGGCLERGRTITSLWGEFAGLESMKPVPALFFHISLYSFRSVWPQSLFHPLLTNSPTFPIINRLLIFQQSTEEEHTP